MRTPTLLKRDPRYSLAYQCASDSGESVQIHRSLEDGNGPEGPEAWDPIVNVFFASRVPTDLHPSDTEAGDVGDGWQKIRWSEVNDLIEALLDARDAAIRTGMLPTPLSNSERAAKADQVAQRSGRAPVWGREAIRIMRRIEKAGRSA